MPAFMKKTFLFALLLYSIGVSAQHQTAATIPMFYEKVFVHTDRDQYAAGEDIWFKAYLVNAQSNQPIANSNNLYVELINNNAIIVRRVIRVEHGLGNGDFKLPDTITAGTYRIRAYTNWMRNFGDNFIFEKPVTIINPLHYKPIAKAKPAPRQRKVNIKADTAEAGPVVRFFPEGGSLVNDVCSVVAVKAEDEYGKGFAATGQVIATSGRTVAKFTCDSLGMGIFTLCPDGTQDYKAVVTIGGQPLTFKLPKAQPTGFNLSVSMADSTIAAVISTNKRTLLRQGGSNLVVIAKHGGKTYFEDQLPVTANSLLLQIPASHFPEGIACVTVMDEHNQPLCERLVYVHHASQTMSFTITTDKLTYQPREQATLNLKLCDATSRPVSASLSVAVVDAGIAPVAEENIQSYLELQSEIKGSIEHAGLYFDPTNTTRFKQLDMLLLTQGWRDFVWKRIADTTLVLNYEVEQSMPITGRVRAKWRDKPLNDINITMFATKAKGDKLFTAKTDSAGRFRIDGAVLYGYHFSKFTARTDKGEAAGWVMVDSLFQNRLPVTPLMAKRVRDTIVSKPLATRENQKVNFSGNNQLNEVKITSNKEVFLPEIHPITMTEQKDFANMGQYLLYMMPGTLDEGSQKCPTNPLGLPIATISQYAWPFPVPIHINYRVADGSKPDIDCADDPLGLPMDRYLKATITRHGTPEGIRYGVTLILRPGPLKPKDFFDNTVADFSGYYRVREFYKPNHEQPDDRADLRTTIHWEPNINTNEMGQATINYYNADPKTKVRIIAQGITEKGIPVVATASYEVK